MNDVHLRHVCAVSIVQPRVYKDTQSYTVLALGVVDNHQVCAYSGSTSERSIGKEGGFVVNRRVMS